MKLFRIILLLSISPIVFASETDIAKLYQSHGITGSLMIQSLDGEHEYQYNSNMNDKGYIPASTFKIPNTLIALEEGVIKDQNSLIKWDNVKRDYDAWNKDQTLKTAFSVSCVWCYQKFSRKIGEKKYKDYLSRFDYGNGKTGEDISTFWLEGDLRMSVRQQIIFLKKVYKQKLPIKKSSYETLKAIMLSEETPTYRMWSKTGWAGKDGWFVGYIEIDKKIWFFANHIEIHSKDDLALRKKLTLEAFKLLGIMGEN
ncbi:MAG: class D beta-lactamase [Gammaproteobacteria bacterium]|nr:class D beta-lactamase [Gammaproteobacteria bacterium]